MSQKSITVAFTELRELQPDELANLAQYEADRASSLKAQRRRQQFLCGRALLRTILERHTGENAASHQLVSDDKGKPHCVDGPAVSIAHSGNLIVCAVTNLGDIGIDIEVPRRQRDTVGIAETYFSGEESRWLTTQPADRFYMLWVLKEAWLKATGLGLAGGLDRLRCIVTPPDIEAHIAGGKLQALSLYALHDALIGIATTRARHDDVMIDNDDASSCQLVATTDNVQTSESAVAD